MLRNKKVAAILLKIAATFSKISIGFVQISIFFKITFYFYLKFCNIFLMNSSFDFVWESILIILSVVSAVPKLESALLIASTAAFSSSDSKSSSLRVPDLFISIAGNIRFSESFSVKVQLHVASTLELFKYDIIHS